MLLHFFSNDMLSICSVFFIQLVYSLSMIYCKRETPDTRSNNKSKTNRQRHAKKNIIENSNLNIMNPNKILRNIGLCTCLSLLVMIQHKILRNMGLCTWILVIRVEHRDHRQEKPNCPKLYKKKQKKTSRSNPLVEETRIWRKKS